MNNSKEKEQETMKEIKEISKWSRRYAEHRSVGPMLVHSGIVILIAIFIFGLSYLGGQSYRAGNMVTFWFCIVPLVVIVLPALIFFSVPRWGGKLGEKWGKQLFAKDGEVVMAAPRKKKHKWIMVIAGTLFGGCIVGSIIWGMHGGYDIKYMQPISALYLIPFMVVFGIFGKPATTSPLMWLWPLLYLIQAVMIVVDMWPFSKIHPGLNMFIATYGYGFLTGLASYLYSRFVLRKLKQTARMDAADIGEQQEAKPE